MSENGKMLWHFYWKLTDNNNINEKKTTTTAATAAVATKKMILWKRKENGVSNISSTIVQYILSFYDNLHSTPD